MRVDAQQIVDDWQHATQGELLDEPGYVRSAREELERNRSIEQQHFFDMEVDSVQKVIAAAAQLELQLPEMDERKRVRECVAEYFDRVILPATDSRSIHRIPGRLRSCRQKRDTAILPSGKTVVRWDEKAGLPLLCPDDAREEAMRISRRYVPAIMDAIASGHSVHSCVFTIDNPEPGKLRSGIRKLHRKLNSLWRSCKRADPAFPIIGGISVLEAPLGRYRDWHPHLNVILICDGYLDYGDLRARWGCNAHFQRLRGELHEVKAAVRELIKYSVRSVPEKSQEKACGPDDEPRPPPLVEWSSREYLEWHFAHRGLRRTRTFGSLYKVAKPEKLDTSGAMWICSDVYNGRRYVRRFPLLESIPGDKSTAIDIRQRVAEAFVKILGPPGQVERAKKALQMIHRSYGPVSLSV